MTADTNDTNHSSAVSYAPAKSSNRSVISLLGAIRTAIAGVLMGIANLIPGVSGGTMILAMGLYQEFIDSVADVTALRLSARRIVFLGLVVVFAGGSIVGLAGVILYLLFHYPEAMFALFIGLTLGGAPLLLRELRPLNPASMIAVVVGLAAMIVIASLGQGAFPHNTGMDFVSGVVGSTTMVLPGISGSYMLLILDQYDRVVGAVDTMKEGLKSRDVDVLKAALWIVIPVGIGAVLGIVILSNVLKWLLHHHHKVTIGALLGILLGSVFGLWPFGREPSEKALEKRTMAELVSLIETRQIPGWSGLEDHAAAMAFIRENWSKRAAPDYTTGSVMLAIVLVVGGFVATFLLSQLQPKAKVEPALGEAGSV
jgi:putative membrane protein